MGSGHLLVLQRAGLRGATLGSPRWRLLRSPDAPAVALARLRPRARAAWRLEASLFTCDLRAAERDILRHFQGGDPKALRRGVRASRARMGSVLAEAREREARRLAAATAEGCYEEAAALARRIASQIAPGGRLVAIPLEAAASDYSLALLGALLDEDMARHGWPERLRAPLSEAAVETVFAGALPRPAVRVLAKRLHSTSASARLARFVLGRDRARAAGEGAASHLAEFLSSPRAKLESSLALEARAARSDPRVRLLAFAFRLAQIAGVLLVCLLTECLLAAPGDDGRFAAFVALFLIGSTTIASGLHLVPDFARHLGYLGADERQALREDARSRHMRTFLPLNDSASATRVPEAAAVVAPRNALTKETRDPCSPDPPNCDRQPRSLAS